MEALDIKGASVLVTGDTGFKGSWLVALLSALGANVVGFSQRPTDSQAVLCDMVSQTCRYKHIDGDIRIRSSLGRLLSEESFDFVFHLAAQPLVIEGFRDPRVTYETNIVGLFNVLDIWLEHSTSSSVFINVTTDKVYRNDGRRNCFSEEDTLGGVDPYSASKACAELLSEATVYRINDDRKIATARGGNVVGGGDWSESRLLPDIIRHVFLDHELIIRSINATRPFQHVLDVLTGYVCLAHKARREKLEKFSSWNFGPTGDSLKVSDVISTIENCQNKKLSYISDKPNQFHEHSDLKLDSSKAKERLNWKPLYSPTQALEKSFSWYADYYAKASPKQLIPVRIEKYLSELYDKD